jgi:hypothetical protein
VRKMARTTCITTGKITAISVNMQKVFFGNGIATFGNQIVISPAGFAGPGDSGSLIVTKESCPRAVGLLFAGNKSFVLANPISAVLTKLNASMNDVFHMVGSCTPQQHPTPRSRMTCRLNCFAITRGEARARKTDTYEGESRQAGLSGGEGGIRTLGTGCGTRAFSIFRATARAPAAPLDATAAGGLAAARVPTECPL